MKEDRRETEGKPSQLFDMAVSGIQIKHNSRRKDILMVPNPGANCT